MNEQAARWRKKKQGSNVYLGDNNIYGQMKTLWMWIAGHLKMLL
jgi:hypothetical protein